MTHRRQLAAAVLAAATAVTLAACGSSSGPTAHAAGAASTAPATAAPTSQLVQPPTIAPATFTGEAVTVFGADRLQQAYQQMAAFAAAYTFDPKLVKTPSKDLTPADFTGPTAQMDPTMTQQWNQSVPKALAGDDTANSNVEQMMFFSWSLSGGSWRDSGPVLVNHTIGNATATVDRSTGSARLSLTYDQAGDVLVLEKGKPAQLHLTKKMTAYLVPAPAGARYSWLIDGFTGTWHTEGTGS